jgi:hypothetical protein
MLVFNPRRPSVHPLLLDELAAVRVDDLRRRATPERPAPPPAPAGERSGATGRGVV